MTATIDLVFNPDHTDDLQAMIQRAIDAIPKEEFGTFAPPRAEPLVGQVAYQRWLARTPSAPIAVDLTQDFSVPVDLLSIISEDEQLAVSFAERLWAVINAEEEVLLGPDALVARAAQPQATPADLVRAALSEKANYNATLDQAIQRALTKPEKAWREAGAKSAALTAWSELADALSQALAKEKDPEVTRMLQMAQRNVLG